LAFTVEIRTKIDTVTKDPRIARLKVRWVKSDSLDYG